MVATSEEQSLRTAGFALLIGAVLTFVGSLAEIPADGVGSFNRPAWILIHLLVVLGTAAILLGLPALYLKQAHGVGVVGLLGFALVFLGFLGIGFFVATAQTVLLPWVYDKASCTLGCHLLNTSDGPPLFGWFSLIESLATFVGLILAGVSTARASIFPASTGYALAFAGVLAIPLAFITVAPILAVVPLLLALIAVSWMAVTLIADRLT